jgi:hypothetical protein
LDAEDPRVKLGVTPAKLDQVVPYQYAHNTKDGTPLYRTVPSREQMNEYEPYLTSAVRAREREEKRRRDDEDQEDGTDREDRDADAGVGLPSPGENAEADAGAIPWWQRTPDGGKADIKLAELNEGSDSVLARRMVKGFYVAVDRAFGWNNRLWYKTTEGLVAPADRMSINKPPSFHGVDLGGTGQPKLPIGFINGAGAFKFELSADGKSFEKKGRAAFHTIAALTGKTQSRGGVDYWETVEGWWMKAVQSTMTEPGPLPDGIGPDEKWIDVNVTRQTLVMFEGNRPVFATLVSTGKKGATKKTDHSTVLGSFRIREKHVAATMDGDGALPGDAPYSIQDVPYVMYFKGSYALHGAFWHANFGNKMSHGCVNLSPLDSKRVFLWAEPNLPQGWHGAWASKDHPGSLVVVHE